MKAAKKIPIPFSSEGDQLHYVFYSHSTWRDNEPFEDTLTYMSYSRGRSAAYFNFRRLDGTSVTVFMTDIDEMIPHIHGGKIRGRFQFSKRGQNYGCTMLEALAPLDAL